MSDWISVEDKLPENFGTWKEYLITMLYPCSEYEYRVVATALYDSRQKIWHLNPFSEEGEEKTVNALILPAPPSIFVGVKHGQSIEEVKAAIKEYDHLARSKDEKI